MYGILDRKYFVFGGIDFYIDYQDNSYYGEKAYKYFVPSALNPDCFDIDFTKQFRTYEKCETYIKNKVLLTAKRIVNETS